MTDLYNNTMGVERYILSAKLKLTQHSRELLMFRNAKALFKI
jgi:hypothetical protein